MAGMKIQARGEHPQPAPKPDAVVNLRVTLDNGRLIETQLSELLVDVAIERAATVGVREGRFFFPSHRIANLEVRDPR